MKNDAISQIELILPAAVVEACYKLKRTAGSKFRALDKTAGTSSDIVLFKQSDDSVCISICVTRICIDDGNIDDTTELFDDTFNASEIKCGNLARRGSRQGRVAYKNGCTRNGPVALQAQAVPVEKGRTARRARGKWRGGQRPTGKSKENDSENYQECHPESEQENEQEKTDLAKEKEATVSDEHILESPVSADSNLTEKPTAEPVQEKVAPVSDSRPKRTKSISEAGETKSESTDETPKELKESKTVKSDAKETKRGTKTSNVSDVKRTDENETSGARKRLRPLRVSKDAEKLDQSESQEATKPKKTVPRKPVLRKTLKKPAVKNGIGGKLTKISNVSTVPERTVRPVRQIKMTEKARESSNGLSTPDTPKKAKKSSDKLANIWGKRRKRRVFKKQKPDIEEELPPEAPVSPVPVKTVELSEGKRKDAKPLARSRELQRKPHKNEVQPHESEMKRSQEDKVQPRESEIKTPQENKVQPCESKTPTHQNEIKQPQEKEIQPQVDALPLLEKEMLPYEKDMQPEDKEVLLQEIEIKRRMTAINEQPHENEIRPPGDEAQNHHQEHALQPLENVRSFESPEEESVPEGVQTENDNFDESDYRSVTENETIANSKTDLNHQAPEISHGDYMHPPPPQCHFAQPDSFAGSDDLYDMSAPTTLETVHLPNHHQEHDFVRSHSHYSDMDECYTPGLQPGFIKNTYDQMSLEPNYESNIPAGYGINTREEEQEEEEEEEVQHITLTNVADNLADESRMNHMAEEHLKLPQKKRPMARQMIDPDVPVQEWETDHQEMNAGMLELHNADLHNDPDAQAELEMSVHTLQSVMASEQEAEENSMDYSVEESNSCGNESNESEMKQSGGAPKKPYKREYRIQCRICQVKVKDYCYLFRHVGKLHTDVPDYRDYMEELRPLMRTPCPICGITVSTISNMASHMRQKHSDSADMVNCPTCKKVYKTPTSLKQHMRVCHAQDDKRYVCDICQAKFGEKRGLEEHVNCAHVTTKVFHCELCRKPFLTKGRLRRHVLTHGEFRFKCQYCDKGFHLRDNMNKHIEIVHEQNMGKRFECEYCNKKFTVKGNMMQHVLGVHLKKRLYSCSVCNSSFRRKGDMLKHMENKHPQHVNETSVNLPSSHENSSGSYDMPMATEMPPDIPQDISDPSSPLMLTPNPPPDEIIHTQVLTPAML